MFDDPVLVKHVSEHGIHLEFCPTSNTALTDCRKLADHPIRQAFEQGMSFSINSDDPGPLCTTMNNEYVLVQNLLGLDESDFDMILINSLSASFGRKRDSRC